LWCGGLRIIKQVRANSAFTAVIPAGRIRVDNLGAAHQLVSWPESLDRNKIGGAQNHPGSGKVACMSKTDIMSELPKLTPDERREILDKIWELDGGDWLDSGELTNADRVFIEQRLAEHEGNPDAAVSWNEVEARLRQRFNQ
jgi:putative addiction module component (TIGR02574 family)